MQTVAQFTNCNISAVVGITFTLKLFLNLKTKNYEEKIVEMGDYASYRGSRIY